MREGLPYYDGSRKEIAGFLPISYTRVLEIGCGEGGFRTNLGSCEYWGIEPTPAAKVARGRLFRVFESSYESALDQLPNCYFDLVICNDVIEHMVEHDRFFRTIKQKLSNNAHIVGSVPNVRYIGNLYELLFLKDWRYRDEGVLDRTHLRFFTEKSLRWTFERHGFVMEACAGVNPVKVQIFPLRVFIKNLLVVLFGRDTRFLQFGFRVRYQQPA
jgi:SAM-dependent methyltransferase